MAQVPYINYKELDEFYTIQQLVNLLGVPKQKMKQKCEELSIKPHRNEIGEYGLVRYDVRRLHNDLYRESRGDGTDDDPWA